MEKISSAKVAVTGSQGRLGVALARTLESTGCQVIPFHRHNFPMQKPEQALDILRNTDFDVLINPAAVTAVDYCEDHQEEACRVNEETPALMAEECARRGARMIHVSTDYVFDGAQPGLRVETDEVRPTGVYAATKRDGELAVLKNDPTAVVTRVSWVFGPARPSFPDSLLAKSMAGEKLAAVADKWACPTYAPDLAEWLTALMPTRISGILHLCNSGLLSWREYAAETIRIAAEMGLPTLTTEVAPINRADIAAFIAPRPAHTGMDTSLFTRLTGITPRPWQEAMKDHLRAVHRS